MATKPYKKQFWNAKKTKTAIVSRQKYQNGYSYYVTVIKKGTFGGMEIDGSFRQKDDIVSESMAVSIAKNAIR